MFFHFTGLKEISEKNYTLDLLIQAEDPAPIREFLNFHKAITLLLEPYEQDPLSFGEIFLVIQHKDTQFKIITKFENIQECLENIIPLEITILEVNYTQKTPLSPSEYQNLISSEKAKHNAELEKLKAIKEKEKKAEENLADPRLKKAYEAIEDILNQIEQLQSLWGESIEPIMRKKLEDTRGNISKLRLATNYDKIIEELHNAMNLIIATQDFILDKLESHKIFPIFEGTQVNNVEVIREQTRLAKAQLLKALWAQLSREESMYVSLGYLKLFSQYLEKDIRFALKNQLLVIKNFCKALEIAGLLIMIELACFLVFAPMFNSSFWVHNFWVGLLYLAPFTLLIGFFNAKIKPTNLTSYWVWIWWGILLYMSILSFFKTLLIF